MDVRLQFWTSRHSITIAIAAALASVVSLAISAHAGLNKGAIDVTKPIATEQNRGAAKRASRIALIIGNGHYPDADAPLTQSINDARALTATLQRKGFDVDLVVDASKDDLRRAIFWLKSRTNRDSVVLLFFGGYGVQVDRESYMIPVDAAISTETDVRRDGFSIESVLNTLRELGACAELTVIDASRRNPYERRFRVFSHGLAPINAPDNALILSSATPGKVADESKGEHSVFVSELLNNLNVQGAGVEAVFNKTRIAIARSSKGEQVPSVSSSLAEDLQLAPGEDNSAEMAGS